MAFKLGDHQKPAPNSDIDFEKINGQLVKRGLSDAGVHMSLSLLEAVICTTHLKVTVKHSSF